MDGTQYARLFKKLLPEGPAWPHETDDNSAFDGLIRALSQEPARSEEDALLLLDNLIPDNANTNLTAWERLLGPPETSMTDEERLARIRGMLRSSGEVSRAELEPAFRVMAGDVNNLNIKLHNRARPNFAAGASNAGDACGQHAFVWLAEIYSNTLGGGGVAPDDFSGWSGLVGLTSNDDQSPVTLDATASTATIQAATPASVDFLVGENGEGYFSLWIKPVAAVQLTVRFVDRGGSPTAGVALDLLPDVWQRIVHRENVGSGASEPEIELEVSADVGVALSWAVATQTDPALEARLKKLTQIHTRGVFGVQEEYATLLAHDQLEVCY